MKTERWEGGGHEPRDTWSWDALISDIWSPGLRGDWLLLFGASMCGWLSPLPQQSQQVVGSSLPCSKPSLPSQVRLSYRPYPFLHVQ